MRASKRPPWPLQILQSIHAPLFSRGRLASWHRSCAPGLTHPFHPERPRLFRVCSRSEPGARRMADLVHLRILHHFRSPVRRLVLDLAMQPTGSHRDRSDPHQLGPHHAVSCSGPIAGHESSLRRDRPQLPTRPSRTQPRVCGRVTVPLQEATRPAPRRQVLVVPRQTCPAAVEAAAAVATRRPRRHLRHRQPPPSIPLRQATCRVW